jgi:hypothetical protein
MNKKEKSSFYIAFWSIYFFFGGFIKAIIETITQKAGLPEIILLGITAILAIPTVIFYKNHLSK